jgi:hypothetical protein
MKKEEDGVTRTTKVKEKNVVLVKDNKKMVICDENTVKDCNYEMESPLLQDYCRYLVSLDLLPIRVVVLMTEVT